MATMTERRPGVWVARAFVRPTAEHPKGRQVVKTFYGGKREVKRNVTDWEREVQAAAPTAVGLTVADLLALWQEAKAPAWQPTTVREHRNRSGKVEAALGTVRVSDLDPMRIDRWVAAMRRDGVGEGAIRGRVSTLGGALTWAVSRRIVRSNAVREADPKVRVGRRAVTIEPEQVHALLAAAAVEGPRAGLALRISAATGVREAELVALAWKDLDGNRLRIGRQRHSLDDASLVRERTKSGPGRTIVLDPTTLAHIEQWKQQVVDLLGETGEWMLGAPGATTPPSPRWVYDVFCRAAKAAGIAVGRDKGIVLHDLRRWAGSIALRDGHDPVTVAARLGHSPETLLRVYAQEIAAGQEALALSVEGRLQPAHG